MSIKPSVETDLNVVLLAGGVGGAKMAAGLVQHLPPEQLAIIVNTGDDFVHMGLTVCPDLDTVMYTLGDVANRETGWGRAGETWKTIAEVGRLGGPDWFQLGDLDLATHLTRTYLLNQGETLTAVTQILCQQFGIQHPILPMSDKQVPTLINTEEETLPFQTWFVQRRWQPSVRAVDLPEDAIATHAVALAMQKADVVIIAPSNPFVSIDPILNCYPVRAMLTDLPRAIVAVSPIIGQDAVKGPAAKMMRDWGMSVSATAVSHHYRDLIDGFVIDERDANQATESDLAILATNILMPDDQTRAQVAADVLRFAIELAEA